MGNKSLQPNLPHDLSKRRGPSPGMWALCCGMILILLVGYVFSPCLTAEILVDRDDGQYLYYQGDIWGATWVDAAEAFGRFYFPSETGGYYQPLTTLSYMLDAKIVGHDIKAHSFYFHLSNVVLHLLNVAVLFVLIRTISGSTGWAFLLAAFFGLHPVQVTSVAWVSQRMTVLATFFALLAIGAYLRYAATEGLRWFFAVIVLTALAILARPTFLALPIVFLVLDIWPGGRRGTSRMGRVTAQAGLDAGEDTPGDDTMACSPRPYRALIEKLPLFLLMVWALGLHLYLHLHTNPATDATAEGPALVAMNIASAVKRLLLPVQMGLFHPLSQEAAGQPGTWLVLAGTLLFALWVFWMVRSLRHNKPLFLALAGTVVWILPAMLDLPYMDELIGDAPLYVAFILPAIALATWLRQRTDLLRHAWGRVITVALCGVVLLFGVRSFKQCFVWQNSRTLYALAIMEYPGWPEGYLGLVRSFLHEADLDAALYWAEQATEVAPDEPETQFLLGKVLTLHQDGRAEEAIEPLQKALASNPNWIECLQLLGEAMLVTNHMDEAEAYLERARDLDPAKTTVHTLLGEVYLQTQRPSSARAEFQRALKANRSPEAHLGLARAWAINGRPDLAARHLAAAVDLDPQFKAAAATYPELLQWKEAPGFEGLIDATTQPSAETKQGPDTATDGPIPPPEDAAGDEEGPGELPETLPNTLGA